MIKLDDEIRNNVATAIDNLKTMTTAYVDINGRPHISFYGSTHVHSDDELALWVRNPEGSLLKTLPNNPHIAFIYGDIANKTYYTFDGRGRVETDEVIRERVYQEMHPIERKFDESMGGVAVIVALDKVSVLTAAGKRVMER